MVAVVRLAIMDEMRQQRGAVNRLARTFDKIGDTLHDGEFLYVSLVIQVRAESFESFHRNIARFTERNLSEAVNRETTYS